MDRAGATMEPVMIGTSSVARATIGGRLIGGRVSWDDYFLGVLDGNSEKLGPSQSSRSEVLSFLYNKNQVSLVSLTHR